MSDAKKPHKTSATKKSIVDVAEPGTSAPSSTSKPVIVTNRPLLQDPMVTHGAGEKEQNEPEPSSEAAKAHLSSASRTVVQPLADSEAADDEQVPVADASNTDNASTQEEMPDNPDLSAVEAPSRDGGSTPTSFDHTPPPDSPTPNGQDAPQEVMKKQEAVAAEAQARHEAEIQQLVDSGKYVLPIRTVEQRQNRRFATLGIVLAVVLALLWLDIALDAGILKLGGLHAPTHFFSN